VVDLREPGASLDFLGYTFRYDRDLKGRHQKYLNVFPSRKAVQRERAKLHAMTNSHQCFKPISTLLGELNRHLKSWANYFSFGYPWACTGRSTGTCEAVSSGIYSDAVSDLIIRLKERRGIRISSGWGWFVWRVPPSRVLCMPEARVFRRAGRGKSAPPVRRGESGSRYWRRPLSYSTGSVTD